MGEVGEMERIRQKFEELIALSDENKGELYNFIKALISYKLKVHLEEINQLNEDPLPLFEKEVEGAIELLKSAKGFNSSYIDTNLKIDFASNAIQEAEKKVHSLYGSLWVDFDANTYFEESHNLLKTRLLRNNIDPSLFEGKICLDAGCGGGRYTCALAKLGAKKVVGMDIGTKGISDARKRIQNTEFESKVEFLESSVLDIPFKEESFDFVMSNGVLHHTTDPLKGIEEIYRLLKPGGKAWIYLYGKGGLEELTIEYIRKLLRDVPRELTQNVMILLGLPPNRRFYMLDHFYVAIRKTYNEDEVREILLNVGFRNITRLLRGTDFDTIEQITQNKPYAKIKHGVGDLRFIVEKINLSETEKMKTISIGDKVIGQSHSCFIIAEIGMNHNGDLDLAKKHILKAKEIGCDAVKFQMFTAEKLVTKNAKTYGNEDGHLPEYQQEMYKKYELSKENYLEIKKYCDDLGIIFFSSIWDEENADLLDEVGGSCFKVGSADITHLPLLRHIANKNKPIILSVGMATLEEIREAIDTILSEGNGRIVLLHCISGYPTKIEESNLRFIETLRKEFPFTVGFSDHTPGPFSSVAAVALGAKVIEKHFTIDKKLPGVDHHLSMDVPEMKDMIEQIRLLEKALGSGKFHLTDAEKETRQMARRSIITSRFIPKETIITADMLTIKRPGMGLEPKQIDYIIGRVALADIEEDTILEEDMTK